MLASAMPWRENEHEYELFNKQIPMTLSDFDDIRCYTDEEVNAVLTRLAEEPGIEKFLRGAFPDIDMEDVKRRMRSFHSIRDFHMEMVGVLLFKMSEKITEFIRLDGGERISKDHASVFITNHRDIVLDSAYLDILMLNAGYPDFEIAIGDNLLIYPWIKDLVRANKSFIVRRELPGKELLLASKHLSQYIHYTISEQNTSIWIAQREGRSKDCSDLTQAAVIKMLAMGGPSRDLLTNIKALNLQPCALSYEYDPCDYLKAQEFQLKRDNPEWHKSKQDDLFSMANGMLGYKGRVIFTVAPELNPDLNRFPAELTDKGAQATAICEAVDRSLHANMYLFEINYVAYDLLNETDKYADRYTEEQKIKAVAYLNSRLEKINIPNRDEAYLWKCLLTQYANPVANKEKLTERATTPFNPLT